MFALYTARDLKRRLEHLLSSEQVYHNEGLVGNQLPDLLKEIDKWLPSIKQSAQTYSQIGHALAPELSRTVAELAAMRYGTLKPRV